MSRRALPLRTAAILVAGALGVAVAPGPALATVPELLASAAAPSPAPAPEPSQGEEPAGEAVHPDDAAAHSIEDGHGHGAATVPNPIPAGAFGILPAAFSTPELRDLQMKAVQSQIELAEGTFEYGEAQKRLGESRKEAEKATALAELEQARYEKLSVELSAYIGALYRNGPAKDMQAVLRAGTDPTRWLHSAGYMKRVRQNQNGLLAETDKARIAAAEARREAARTLASATQEAADVAAKVEQLKVDAANVSAALTKQMAKIDADVAEASAAQKALNQAASARWSGYLASLAAMKVVPPPAAALADPAKLPPGLSALIVDGAPVPGFAVVAVPGQPALTVMSAQTIQAVSLLFAQLGKPYAKDAVGPADWSCGGLTKQVWGAVQVPLPASAPEQWQRSVPVPVGKFQIGDLVFTGGDGQGITGVGTYIGAGQVIHASRAEGAVQVEALPEDALNGSRPGTQALAATTRPLPAGPDKAADRKTCGAADPVLMASPFGNGPRTTGKAAWGGFPNGLIPSSALCALPQPGMMLRCDAAKQFAAMNEAFTEQFTVPICITDSYRSYAQQIDVYIRKPNLAAIPGTSNHGWAQAVDLCGGIQNFGTPEHEWLAANAGRFGWVHPPWARQTGGKPEAWHFEFGAIS